MRKRTRRAKPKVDVEPISVWQALNQPIVEVTGEAARGIFLMTAVIMLAVWIAPYWGSAPSFNSSPLVGEERWGGVVSGVQIVAEITTTPEWYYIAEGMPNDVTTAFAQAADDVLDISEPVSEIAEFYGPGFSATWNAWLELMADPY